ncbi:MAG: hypothetical protein ACQERF_11580 [Actinomycetota bacterium]
MDELVISRRRPRWMGWLGGDPRPVLTLRPDGLLLEAHDLIPWQDLDAVGEFATEYGRGAGLRLRDPLDWYRDHHGPWRTVYSVITIGRSPAQLADIFGVRDPDQVVPGEASAKVEWARRKTGGWDLTIPDRAIAGGAASALAAIEDFRRRHA